jgi:DNA-binding response OmpR family regulator
MRLLLVEDDTKLSSFIVKGLRQAGFAVDYSDTGRDGIHMAIREKVARVTAN